jgi:hypothetical protein
MEFSLLAVVGISLGLMFFGYFFGLFEGRRQGYKKGRQEETSDHGARAASAKLSPPTGGPADAGRGGPHKEALLEISRDETGRPLLHLDGERLDAPNVTRGQRKRLVELMVMLRPWIEGSGASAPSRDADIPATALSPTMADRLRIATSPVREPTATPAQPITTPPLPSTALPIGSPLNMVAQIDAILQANLVGTPLANRRIRLTESPDGGATVFVGTTRYLGVGDVPDHEIQAAIRAATAEWEKRFTPG